MQVHFYFHAGGFPVIQLREIQGAVFEAQFSGQHPSEIETHLTEMLRVTRIQNAEIHQQMFAVIDIGENARIIGAEVLPDHRLQAPLMRYLSQSASHQIADAVQTLSRQ